jgi:hypothetical protein
MTEAFATIGRENVRSMTLRIPQSGCWSADVVMTGDPVLTGTLDVRVAGTTLRGTVVESMAGVYVGTTAFRLVGGHGGWAKSLPARHYHNDGAGVRALVIAQDAARESGEVLGTFTPTAERVGVDYVRTATVPAVKALEDAAGGALWWVELDGTTTVGVRPVTELDAKACPVLAYDPMERVATIGIDGLEAVRIGAVITQHVDTPQTIREMVISISEAEPLRARVWTGGTDRSAGRLVSLLRGIAQRATDKPLYGLYRYRVVSRVGERIEAESVRADLPDVRPIAMWPGVAGCYAELAIGTEVLITFIDGNPAQPVITAFAPSGSPGFVPERLALAGTSGPAAARVGDSVEVDMPHGVAPSGGGPIVWTPYQPGVDPKASGQITSGSSKVDIA